MMTMLGISFFFFFFLLALFCSPGVYIEGTCEYSVIVIVSEIWNINISHQ